MIDAENQPPLMEMSEGPFNIGPMPTRNRVAVQWDRDSDPTKESIPQTFPPKSTGAGTRTPATKAADKTEEKILTNQSGNSITDRVLNAKNRFFTTPATLMFAKMRDGQWPAQSELSLPLSDFINIAIPEYFVPDHLYRGHVNFDHPSQPASMGMIFDEGLKLINTHAQESTALNTIGDLANLELGASNHPFAVNSFTPYYGTALHYTNPSSEGYYAFNEGSLKSSDENQANSSRNLSAVITIRSSETKTNSIDIEQIFGYASEPSEVVVREATPAQDILGISPTNPSDYVDLNTNFRGNPVTILNPNVYPVDEQHPSLSDWILNEAHDVFTLNNIDVEALSEQFLEQP